MSSYSDQFDKETKQNLDIWLNGNYDQETKKEIHALLKSSPGKVIDAFYTNLSFGTGGLRGIMGPGTNRMNKYTVACATQGLANYIKASFSETNRSVVISYDSRNNSHFFATVAAKVLAGNLIKVHIFNELRPVPMVSFAVRHLKCSAGIMITASHNPPEYNGYKVYWEDGAQVLPPHDVKIIEEVSKIKNIEMIHSLDSLESDLIYFLDNQIDRTYLDTIKPLQINPELNKKEGPKLKIVYTSLHGSGITMVPKALEDWGFTSYQLVKEQEKPDGNFPTVEKPNPEEKAALKLGIDLLENTQSDILLGTDPDCDRIGVAVRHNCKAVLLNGNETASICLYYICKTLQRKNKLPKNAAFVKTIVTSELLSEIANSFNKPCFNVLTGFKYIGQLIHKWEINHEDKTFLFGGEESYGYLIGTHARDKDAIVMSSLIAEVANWAKVQKKTFIDILYEIYLEFGIFRESLTSINFPDGKEGKEKIKNIMDKLRATPPKHINNIPITSIEDYSTSIKKDIYTQKEKKIDLPQSNVLLFWLQDKTKFVIRPSGTESKIKIYIGVKRSATSNLINDLSKADEDLNSLIKAFKKTLS